MRRFGGAWRAVSHAGRSTAAVGGLHITALRTASSRATGSLVGAAPVDGKAAQPGSYDAQAGSAWIHVRGIAAGALRAAGEVVPPPEGQMYTGEEFNGEIDLDKKQVRSPTPRRSGRRGGTLPTSAPSTDRSGLNARPGGGRPRRRTRRASRGLHVWFDAARGFGTEGDSPVSDRPHLVGDDHAPWLGLRDGSGGEMGRRCDLLARRGFIS